MSILHKPPRNKVKVSKEKSTDQTLKPPNIIICSSRGFFFLFFFLFAWSLVLVVVVAVALYNNFNIQRQSRSLSRGDSIARLDRMAHSHGSSDPNMAVAMVFQNIPATPLYTLNWTPRTSGAYAGTCIFLIVLGVVARALLTAKSIMDRRFLAAARARRYVVVQGRISPPPGSPTSPTEPESERSSEDADEKKMGRLISAHGVEESVRVVNATAGPPVMPWRFSVDLPRAAMVTLNAGVGYLLYDPSPYSPLFSPFVVVYPMLTLE